MMYFSFFRNCYTTAIKQKLTQSTNIYRLFHKFLKHQDNNNMDITAQL